MNHERLIQHYFSDTLSKEDEHEVNRLLETDPTFKSAFEDYKNLQAAFIHKEKQELKLFLSSIDNKSVPFYKKILNNKPVLLAIASCLIIGVFYFRSDQNTANIYNDYFDTYPNVYQPIVRGTESSPSTEAFRAYENGEFIKAEKEFEGILSSSDNNIAFYYAMSLLNQDKTMQAEKVLDNLKSKNHEFLAEVYWYSALISVKNKNNTEALDNLIALQKLNSAFKVEEIEELIEKLK